MAVEFIDQIRKILRRSHPARRRKKSARRVAHALVIRIFHHRHQLHMRVTHLRYIGNKFRRRLPVAERRSVAVLLPCVQIHLVHRHRSRGKICRFSCRKPVFVIPGEVQVGHDGSAVRSLLVCPGIRIGLQINQSRFRLDLEFIITARLYVRHEEFKNARLRPVHLADASVPSVKITDNGHTHGIRRPDGEIHALGVVDFHQVSAKFFPCMISDPVGKPGLFLLRDA